MRIVTHRSLLALALAATLTSLGCAVETPADVDSQDEDLTSLTALARTLQFAGYVYVDTFASDATILQAMRKQTQSAFGALREANVGVNSRELKDIDFSTAVKVPVDVVDPKTPGSGTKKMLRVSYKYTDTALVPKSMAKRSSIALGLLFGNYWSQNTKILKECTSNDKHAQEFASSIWYVFNPAISSCKAAMTAEQKKINADKKLLKIPTKQVPLSEVNRLYLPVTMKLTGDKTNKGLSYPEYDKLFTGGVQKGKLVINMVNGLMADWADGQQHDPNEDDGYPMWFEGLREIFSARPGLTLVKIEPKEDLSTFTIGTKKVTGVKFTDIMKWELDGVGFPSNITSYDERKQLRVSAANKLLKHWLTFEVPVKVKIGTATAKTFTIQLNTYFGADSDYTPHKKAIKTGDVFIYNGHSYIGYGPLDPKNFSSSDFPSTYQIMFINGCVSFNYYEKDYFPLKAGGTKTLDLVTNGLESWVNESGPAMGRFVGTLINGKMASYKQLLEASQFTDFGYSWGMDALRVVDGELDNTYSPAKKPIIIKQ